ncbi:MAG TPA: ATP-binding protein [Candidatus Obscuribacter sp.]|nr:ATP-binding protein [Candidatus Obscuribacter sp.]HNM50948.1 ATP-binding protein [Candidatus Obscuribacter sp.]
MQNPVESEVTVPDPFSGFDFQAHGTDEGLVRALADLTFIRKGENVLVLGGIGSGKTTLAGILAKQASLHGLTVQTIDAPSCYYPRLPTRYLECDLLLLDEAHIWVDVAPLALLALILKRHELGKSTILVCVDSNWQRMLAQAKAGTIRTDANRERLLLEGLSDQSAFSPALTWLTSQRWSPVVVLHLLGCGPTLYPSEAEELAPYLQYQNRTPHWYFLNTGEKNWGALFRKT